MSSFFGKLADRVEAKLSRTPPPIPYGTKPHSHGQPAAGNNDPGVYWRPTFHPSKPLSDDWVHETGQTGWGNNELQNYTSSPQNSFATPHGQLVVRAVVQSGAPTPGERHTSARLLSRQRLARNSGCLRARLTGPCARGVWPAFWLLPAEPSRWPEDGEVDIFESWNGVTTNHSCLHWGHYNGEDWNKHRVVETPIPRVTDPRGTDYAFVWQQPDSGVGGRMLWYIDGQPVMKADIPPHTRRMSDWWIILNVAMGGTVCEGATPADGYYDMVIHHISMTEQPPYGWQAFDAHWRSAKEGHAM